MKACSPACKAPEFQHRRQRRRRRRCGSGRRRFRLFDDAGNFVDAFGASLESVPARRRPNGLDLGKRLNLFGWLNLKPKRV